MTSELFGDAFATTNQSTNSAPVVLSELLASIDRKKGTRDSMLHSVALRFLEYVASTGELVSIAEVYDRRDHFIAHLKASKYKCASVKSYRNYLNILLRRAQELGWVRPALEIPGEWQEIIDVMPSNAAKLIVQYAVQIGRSPSGFGEDDLAAWKRERAIIGRSLEASERECCRFRNAITRSGLSRKLPLVKVRNTRYGIAFNKMHPELRREVEAVIAWKLNEFEIDRPAKARIRPISAMRLKDLFSQLTGYIQNILGRPDITSLSGLITRDHLARFASWARNERKIKGQSLTTGLGALYAALRHNPHYAELDLTWFKNIIDQLPVDSQAVVDERKAKKYIPYSVAELIPERIRAARMKLKRTTPRMEAIYARDELLMLWILLLPWRQRNIRELRIGDSPNLFKAAIRQYCTATKPQWIEEQARLSPDAVFWQIRFSPEETKMNHSVQMFLPGSLVPLLEDYLHTHRHVLVGNRTDPGTLFLNHKGKPMSIHQFRNLVRKLASQHTGVSVTPHIYRDIVAFDWLRTHPEDYLTVSKVLWHRNINTTIRIYGHRFDESTGVARMEDWRASQMKTAA